ncbi:MAG: hypothetical protein QNK36_00130 [Colwellia sp.]|nr:hypothetical protein [Colwellia sp.]
MKIRRQISASARRKHLKVQHSKINTRRQIFFNQIITELNDPQNIKMYSLSSQATGDQA